MVNMADNWRTTLLVPDVQYPYHDRIMLSKIISVIKDVQPARIVQIGDGPDFKEVSRWSKGTAAEYAPTLQANIDGFRKDVLVPIREAAPKADLAWVEGNHCKRIKDFIRQYAYPLTSLRSLSMEALFGLDELEIGYKRGPLTIAPGVDAVHGHESKGYAASPAAWDLKFLKRYGSDRSIVFGHTHQPFITTAGHGSGGKIKNRFVMNVGSIMDFKSADYVADGSVSWTHSLGLLHDNGRVTVPELVIAKERKVFTHGKAY